MEHLQDYGPDAVVTGASSGIGEQFARLLAASGFNLVLVARREERLLELQRELQGAHDVSIRVLTIDLSAPDAANALREQTSDIDIGLLVSNAGFGLKGLHEVNDENDLQAMINVNCMAPMKLAHQFLPAMSRRDRSGILFTIPPFIKNWSTANSSL